MGESSLTTVDNSGVQKYSFEWIIVNFSEISKECEHNECRSVRIKRTTFKIRNSTCDVGIFQLCNNYYLRSFCPRNKLGDPNISKTNCSICLVDSSNQMSFAKSGINSVSKKISRKQLFNQMNKYLPGDTLTMKCQFEFLYKLRVTSFQAASYPAKHNSEICSDLMALLESQKCSDVTIRCNNSQFPAHKAILSARSPVFSNMFQYDMLENQTNIVDIPDITAPVVEALLHYIYGSQMEELLAPDICFDLYEAANKYQILQLGQHCASIMVRNLSVDTVCEVAALADVHQDSDLFAAAKSFVKSHGLVSKLFLSKTWFDLVQRFPETARLLIAS